MNEQETTVLMVGLVVAAIALAVFLAIQAAICWFVSKCLKSVPQEHHKISPGLVWLLMIPCVPIVWNFFVYQQVPDSFKSYFDSVGRTDVGDCGKGFGLAYAICSVCCVVPLLNYIAWIPALVLLIMLLVKFNDLKNQIG